MYTAYAIFPRPHTVSNICLQYTKISEGNLSALFTELFHGDFS